MKSCRSITSFATTVAISFGVLTASVSSNACAQSCPGDINRDGQVDGADLGALLSTWGICPALAPTISSLNPSYGPQSGGTVFVINGTNLTGATSVTVGGVAATIIAAYPTMIAATAPASATTGAKNVVVTIPGGTATAVDAFTYNLTLSWAIVLEFLPDPAVVTNVTMRNKITASGRPWRVRDTATQMEMLLVPEGTFVMGCTPENLGLCGSNENPTHSVTLTQAFYMGRYEVTQSQWAARMGFNPSHFAGESDSASRPVESVSWWDTHAYLLWTGMRLPSEAEWEYACRAGTTSAFNNGSSDTDTVGTIAWYRSNSADRTHRVGGKAANALGLYDMSGNVFEWVEDWFGEYSSAAQTDPLGPVDGANRVFRGGAWKNYPTGLRSSNRHISIPNGAARYIGFRVARNP